MESHCLPTLSKTIGLVFVLVSTFLVGVAQDTVTGAFEGTVTNSQTGQPIAGATAEITNLETGLTFAKHTDARGRFYQGLLAPGVYRIRVVMNGFQAAEVLQRLNIARTGEVVPVPVSLDPLPATATPAPTASVTPPPATTAPVPLPAPAASTTATDLRASLITTEASQRRTFTEAEIAALPLGGLAQVRTFDQLALLAAGVAPPPQTLGSVAGPGQGAGVGTSGQFAVNGLRSRANNFTVDGSDNNDEDIGVRRQGFVALTPQPMESVREYQIITLLAPAQFGRNFGGIVNAVTRSGGNQPHGALYGFINSSQFNARNFFDTTGGNASTSLLTADGRAVLFEGQPLTVRQGSGGEDSFTFARFGGALGGPVKRDRTFYFLAAEGQVINASQEENFAVPTVEQRGAFGTGATGIFSDPLGTNRPVRATPASRNGSAVFNLFPFPNNMAGIFGPNTFTQELPADARAAILSAKLDHNFKLGGRPQSVTGRYNFTGDRRVIPATGEALFSTLEPHVRTQNFSFFLNSQLSAPDASAIFNQVRLSYGRTRLNFEEVRTNDFLIPSERFPNEPFLLNAPLRFNNTPPPAAGQPASGPINFIRPRDIDTVEKEIGTIGQVIIAGFSPVGVDVYNFPQRRVNNTYQVADELTWRKGDHSLAFGADTRRTELNSDLPRNERTLATFNGGPRLIPMDNGGFRLPTANDPNAVLRPGDLAAFGAASNFFLTLNTTDQDAKLSLRFYQFNFFAQDQWHVRPNLALSYGLRYEYNTTPREVNNRIEKTFTDPSLSLASGLNRFLDGRKRIFDPDPNNIAPRVSLAYSPRLLGKNLATVFRGGYGFYYDQILGAVVSQSRNVFPTFLPLNFGGGAFAADGDFPLSFFNPARTQLFVPDGTGEGKLVPLLLPGTLARLNPAVPLAFLLQRVSEGFPNALGATIPLRKLPTPLAHHYTFSIEQQLTQDLVVSAAYVGTLGRDLLRFTTPNLGPGANLILTSFQPREDDNSPQILGRLNTPTRPVFGLGAINRFEATADSRYDSLQLQVRGRLRRALQFQVSYVFSKALDDVSDVFDLAGAFALPQNSLTLAGERGPANFDVRHRFAYYFVLDVAALQGDSARLRWLLDGLQIAGLGEAQTGQPFTVNSVFDINLDGNLTDRLNTTNGLQVTGDGRRPLRLLTENALSLLAPFGQDGAMARNTFRAGGLIELDLAVSKSFVFARQQQIIFRADFFNFINRANYGVPVRLLEAPGFGQATRTVMPGARVQFALKYVF